MAKLFTYCFGLNFGPKFQGLPRSIGERNAHFNQPSQARAKLTDLVRRAEQGEEVVLMRHGRPGVTLMPLRHTPSAEGRRKMIESVMEAARNKRSPGPNAARSQDFLYGSEGLPE